MALPRFRVLGSSDVPDLSDPAVAERWLNRQREDGWRFVAVLGRALVFEQAPSLAVVSDPGDGRKAANLVDEDDGS